MSSTTLPFEVPTKRPVCDNGRGCSLRGVLPRELQDAADSCSFLSEYLHLVPMNSIGVPEYYPKLSRDLQHLERRNLIYPIKEGLYVHIYPNDKSERDTYVPIEPHLNVNLDHIMPQIETRLLDYVEMIGAATNSADKLDALNKAIDIITTTKSEPGKIAVTPRELQALKYILARDKLGYGILSPLLYDEAIEDISCSGVGPVFVEHKIFKSVESTINFQTEDDLDQFVIWLGEMIKHPVTVRNPIVDATLPDGSRINIVYGTDVSKRGSNFTIRKFMGIPTSIFELVDYGTMDYMMAAYLSFCLEEGLNMFVAGATASGKTTTMNAITTFIPSDRKIVSIEDTPELQVPHKNWIRETTRGSSKESTGSEVGMFDLLRAALRQRPDRIIVGEIRGVEGAIAFQAMQTGHGVMSTFHAASVEKLIQRLTGDPINIPKSYVDNLDICLIQAAVKVPGKGMTRRVTSINEIVGYDPTTESFSVVEAFRWNPATDAFDFPGFMNSFVLEEKIALKRGIPPFKRKMIYTELKRRAKIFQRLHLDKKLKNFYEIFAVIAEAQRQKLL